MPARLNVATLIALLLPPLLWASNSILARMVLAGESPLISPVLLNATRWLVALILLVLLTGVMRWRMSARARRCTAWCRAHRDTRAANREWGMVEVLACLCSPGVALSGVL